MGSSLRRTIGTVLLAALASVASEAIELTLDRRAVEEALDIAHSTIRTTHSRFHADYRFMGAKRPIDFVEIVSPFRRMVLVAETEQRLGRRSIGQRDALAALEPDPARVEVYVELTFHPMNTFIGVPAFEVELMPLARSSVRVQPSKIDRFPRHGQRRDDAQYPFPYPYTGGMRVPSGTEPLLGGTLVAHFDGALLDTKGVYEVVVRDGKTEVGRTGRIDLLRLR